MMYETYPYFVKDEFKAPMTETFRKHGDRDDFCIIGMFVDCHCMMFDMVGCTHQCLPGHHTVSRKKTAELYELVKDPLQIRRKYNDK